MMRLLRWLWDFMTMKGRCMYCGEPCDERMHDECWVDSAW